MRLAYTVPFPWSSGLNSNQVNPSDMCEIKAKQLPILLSATISSLVEVSISLATC